MSNTTPNPTDTVRETAEKVYPTVIRVAHLIAYDNGMINRGETEESFTLKAIDVVSKAPIIKVLKLETFLQTLNAIQLNIIAAGEAQDSMDILNGHEDPVFADKLFNDIFDV